MKVSDSRHVYDRLLGSWSFVRDVPGYASVKGIARICSVGAGLAQYEETAQVSLVNGVTLKGEQRYLYRRLQSANGFQILFHETAELFENLKFRESEDGRLWATATHLCKADFYVSEYELDREERFHVQHTVRGPRKNYSVKTVYRRDILDSAS